MIILDFVGLFVLVFGLIVGLGAVTVIDIHGFPGRKSPYWTEATTRTHKVTKPLIWVGIFSVIVGGAIFFRNVPFVGVPMYLFFIAVVLLLNGIFLSFRVSPYLLQREKEGRASEFLPEIWQRKIMVGFILSGLGWWGAVTLIVWYLVVG